MLPLKEKVMQHVEATPMRNVEACLDTFIKSFGSDSVERIKVVPKSELLKHYKLESAAQWILDNNRGHNNPYHNSEMCFGLLSLTQFIWQGGYYNFIGSMPLDLALAALFLPVHNDTKGTTSGNIENAVKALDEYKDWIFSEGSLPHDPIVFEKAVNRAVGHLRQPFDSKVTRFSLETSSVYDAYQIYFLLDRYTILNRPNPLAVKAILAEEHCYDVLEPELIARFVTQHIYLNRPNHPMIVQILELLRANTNANKLYHQVLELHAL